MTETKYCANCGAEIDTKALTCPSCGVLQADQTVKTAPIKNEGLAAVLSFFLPGVGQVYNGDIGKGLILILINCINIFLTIITLGFWSIIGIPIALIVLVYAVYDAYTTAKNINMGVKSP